MFLKLKCGGGGRVVCFYSVRVFSTERERIRSVVRVTELPESQRSPQ